MGWISNVGLPLPLRRLVFGRNVDRNFGGYLRLLARLRLQQRMRGWEEEGANLAREIIRW